MPEAADDTRTFGGALFHLRYKQTTDTSLRATVEASDFCRGPWSLTTLHGGPVVGLLGWSCESVAPAAMMCSRLTIEMLRPVPLATLSVEARIIKPGRRTVMIDATIRHENKLVARATSLWLAIQQQGVGQVATIAPPPKPTESDDPRKHTDFEYPLPGFNCDTAELRYQLGSHEEEGPGITWLRLRSPLIEGEPNSQFVMMATLSDLAAATGWEPSPSGGNYINPDVTLQLHRLPEGEWVALDANAEQTGNGVALMTSTVFDERGAIGRILQSLVETPVQLEAQPMR